MRVCCGFYYVFRLVNNLETVVVIVVAVTVFTEYAAGDGRDIYKRTEGKVRA